MRGGEYGSRLQKQQEAFIAAYLRDGDAGGGSDVAEYFLEDAELADAGPPQPSRRLAGPLSLLRCCALWQGQFGGAEDLPDRSPVAVHHEATPLLCAPAAVLPPKHIALSNRPNGPVEATAAALFVPSSWLSPEAAVSLFLQGGVGGSASNGGQELQVCASCALPDAEAALLSLLECAPARARLARLCVEAGAPAATPLLARILAAALKRCPRLRTLDATHCPVLQDSTGWSALCSAIGASRLLSSLSCCSCALDGEAMPPLAAALSASRSLHSLDLSHNPLGDQGLQALAAALCQSLLPLQTLTLANCQLAHGATHALAAALSREHCALTSLDVGRNEELNGGVLFDALSVNASLTALAVDGCGLRGDCLRALASAIRENNTLRALDLSDNVLGQHVAQPSLAAALRDNRALLVLDLSRNGVTQQAVGLFAEGLNGAVGLRELRIAGNGLNGHAIQQLRAHAAPTLRVVSE
jgi:hypothetical protein